MKLIMENWRRYQQELLITEARPPWEEEEEAAAARLFPDEPKQKAQAKVDAAAQEKGVSRRNFLGNALKALGGIAALGTAGKVGGERQRRKSVKWKRDYLAANPDATPREVAVASGAVDGLDPPADSGPSLLDWALNPIDVSKQIGKDAAKKLIADEFGDWFAKFEVNLGEYLRKTATATVDLMPDADLPGPWDEPGSLKKALKEAIDRKADAAAKCLVDLVKPAFIEVLHDNPPPEESVRLTT